MADNPYVNKVEYDGSTLMDITDTTAEPGDVADGEVFYAKSGARSIGTGKYASAPAANGNANKANAILYGTVDGTSTATAFTATVAGLTAYTDGTTVMLKNGVVTSAAGFTINVNGIGAKPVYNNMAAATADTTIFNVNYTMLFVFDSTRIEGGAWICYRGYNSDNNTIGYQLRTNSTAMPVITRTRYYRLLFTSADGTKWVPANTGYDNSATSKKTVNSNAIDPFGRIAYMSGTTNVPAGSNVGATVCWSRYALALGYSFNDTGAALVLTFPAPVYVKCAPVSTGGATMEGYVQALPNSNDGKIYIFLGMAYSATNIELYDVHPVYWHDGTGIRLWTGAASSGVSMEDTAVDAAVNAAWPSYTITAPSGVASVDKQTAVAGETVTVTCLYALGKNTYLSVYAGVTLVKQLSCVSSNSTDTFTMPASDVTIQVTG